MRNFTKVQLWWAYYRIERMKRKIGRIEDSIRLKSMKLRRTIAIAKDKP